ncbi:MAG: hypothetical protein U0235_12205 [Polyangiaceae bacterium]
MRACVAILGLSLVCGCGGSEPPAKSAADGTSGGTQTTTTTVQPAGTAKVKTFKQSTESMKVDKVGGSDGALKPDSSPDLAFEAEVEGPIKAVFLISTDAKGMPTGEYQADSIVGLNELPKDFPIAVRAGMLTAGVGVWEGAKMLSRPDGSLEPIGPGAHKLSLYVASTGVLAPGSHVRLIVLRADNTISEGPVADL